MTNSSTIFMPDDSAVQVPTTNIWELTKQIRWCAWAYRLNSKGERAKVPFRHVTKSGDEIKAQSNNTQSWISFEHAVEVAKKMGGQVGIFLGRTDVIPGYRLGGMDLDTCIGDDGVITPWALEAITRLNSYTEKSPSGTGFKIFFLYTTKDIEQLWALFKTQTGKEYKMPSDQKHPPGAEFYIAGRYFAVTCDHYEGSPETINLVTFDDFKWMVEDFGPRLSGKAMGTDAPTSTVRYTTYNKRSGGGDNSRSARAYNACWNARRVHGLRDYKEIKDFLCNHEDEGIRDWMQEKGLAGSEREFNNIFEKTRPIAGTHDDTRCDYAYDARMERMEYET